MTDTKLTVSYTAKDIMIKLEDMHETQLKILAEQKKTNGRVTTLEKVSLGMFMRNNPFKVLGWGFALGLAFIFISNPSSNAIVTIIKALL